MVFVRSNTLDQALDIAGSLTQTPTLTLTDESSCFGAPISGQSGAVASITAAATVTVSGLTGMTTESPARFLTITGADTGANNGTFLIVTFNSATSVDIINTSAVTDANNGSISWTERNPYSLEDDLNYTRTDRAAIKGVAFDAAIPTYVRCTDQVTLIPADLSNIAGKTTDAKAFVITRKFENAPVETGDGYITITDTGVFPHADAVDITGVPINDGFDAGDDESTYVDIIPDGYETAITVLSGPNAGNRIFGRTRAGTSGVEPDSVEIEFRSVAIDAPISGSVAYTWEFGQPTTLDIYYGFRDCLDTMDENAFRTTQVTGLISDAGLGKDVSDIRTTIGTDDGETDLSTCLTNTGAFFPFFDLPDLTPSICEALNTLNEQIGDRIFTGATLGDKDGYTITFLLQCLADAIDTSPIVRTIERLAADNDAGTPRTLPGGLSYTIDATNNGNGSIWIFWRGLLRDPGPVADGNDYVETSTTSFTPHTKIKEKDHINYFTGV